METAVSKVGKSGHNDDEMSSAAAAPAHQEPWAADNPEWNPAIDKPRERNLRRHKKAKEKG